MRDFQNELNGIRERINCLLKDRGITQNAVAAGNAPAQKRINSQLSHGATLSVDTLLRVLAACPDISADWLLRGTGQEKLSPIYSTDKSESENGGTSSLLPEKFVNDLLVEKDRQIQCLLELLKK